MSNRFIVFHDALFEQKCVRDTQTGKAGLVYTAAEWLNQLDAENERLKTELERAGGPLTYKKAADFIEQYHAEMCKDAPEEPK